MHLNSTTRCVGNLDRLPSLTIYGFHIHKTEYCLLQKPLVGIKQDNVFKDLTLCLTFSKILAIIIVIIFN